MGLETNITIAAPLDQVWQILTNFQYFLEWNPQILKVVGEAKAGTKLNRQASASNSSGKNSRFLVQIVEFESNKILLTFN